MDLECAGLSGFGIRPELLLKLCCPSVRRICMKFNRHKRGYKFRLNLKKKKKKIKSHFACAAQLPIIIGTKTVETNFIVKNEAV